MIRQTPTITRQFNKQALIQQNITLRTQKIITFYFWHIFFSNFDKYFSSRYLKTGLERQLEFTALDDNVREIQQVDLKGVKHSLPGHNDLLGLLLHGEGADQGGHFLRSLPLGQLQRRASQLHQRNNKVMTTSTAVIVFTNKINIFCIKSMLQF